MIKFPHFENRKIGLKEFHFKKSIIKNKPDNTIISCDSIIKPYDKRFTLFILRAIQDESICNEKVISFIARECNVNNIMIINSDYKHYFKHANY